MLCLTTPGTVRTLSELQGRDPLILTLARGNYCPKEHPAAPGAGRATTRRIAVALYTDGHDRHRRPSHAAGVPQLGRRPVALPLRPRAVLSKKTWTFQEYTDPEHDPMIRTPLCSSRDWSSTASTTGYWFWGRPSFLRPVARPACRHCLDPPGLGPEHPGLRGCLGLRPTTRSFTDGTGVSPQSTPTSYEVIGQRLLCPRGHAQRPGQGDVIAHFASANRSFVTSQRHRWSGRPEISQRSRCGPARTLRSRRSQQSAADIVAELTSHL